MNWFCDFIIPNSIIHFSKNVLRVFCHKASCEVYSLLVTIIYAVLKKKIAHLFQMLVNLSWDYIINDCRMHFLFKDLELHFEAKRKRGIVFKT